MPSSYTTNLGIELPADGELDGVWGDVVNDNMSILDRAINGGITLSLTGTSSTITTSDGILSDGQNKLLILGGTPSGTHTITISPNDAEKLYYVYNLSGQSVIFTQGSGTTVTVPNNDTAVIYADGGGSGAGVISITDHLSMNSVRITGGTITGITDLAIADGGTGASSAADARTNLGLAIGTNVQAYDPGLQSIAAQTTAADKMLYTTGSDVYAVTDLTAFARTLLDDADAATARGTLSAQEADATLTSFAAYNSNGLITQTALDTFIGRTITAGTAITVTNGNGVSGNPTVAFEGTLGATSVTATADNDGTFTTGTYTPTPVGGNFKRIVNGGAFTIAAPTAAGDYTLIIQMTNGTGAGIVALSGGFNRVAGDEFTTTVGHDFFIYITKCNGFYSAVVQALQ